MEFFGISAPALLSQLLLGLVNGSFYAILSLGLAVIFGLLNVINFAHGALFMLGALLTWMGLEYLEVNYWVMLLLAPLIVGVLGVLIERFLLQWIYKLDHLYGLLLTLGLTMVIEGVFRSIYGVSGLGYDTPEVLEGATDLGFMILPNYRAWVVVASIVSDADAYVNEVVAALRKAGVRAEADTRNEKINYKVREHSVGKVPVILAVGMQEVEGRTVSVRRLGETRTETISLDQAVATFGFEALPPAN